MDFDSRSRLHTINLPSARGLIEGWEWPFRFRKHSSARGRMTAKPPRKSGMENAEEQPSPQLSRAKNSNRLDVASAMEHTSQQRVRCAEHSTKREMAVRARLRARSENSCDRERLNHHDSVVFGKALDVRFWDFRTDSGQAITCEIGLRSLSGGGRPILLSQYPHGHVLSLDILSPDTWTPGCRDKKWPSELLELSANR